MLYFPGLCSLRVTHMSFILNAVKQGYFVLCLESTDLTPAACVAPPFSHASKVGSDDYTSKLILESNYHRLKDDGEVSLKRQKKEVLKTSFDRDQIIREYLGWEEYKILCQKHGVKSEPPKNATAVVTSSLTLPNTYKLPIPLGTAQSEFAYRFAQLRIRAKESLIMMQFLQAYSKGGETLVRPMPDETISLAYRTGEEVPGKVHSWLGIVIHISLDLMWKGLFRWLKPISRHRYDSRGKHQSLFWESLKNHEFHDFKPILAGHSFGAFFYYFICIHLSASAESSLIILTCMQVVRRPCISF
jgi:hypothetical protein